MNNRRNLIRAASVAVLIAVAATCYATTTFTSPAVATDANQLWECDWCKGQYIGRYPPRQRKCTEDRAANGICRWSKKTNR